MSNTSLKTTVEWHKINWRKLERRVYKLQKRIYRASQRGDVKTFRRLQKTLMKSWSARALSVRRVTQDNRGKKTAGVDGIKTLTPKQRLTLITELKLGNKVCPTRRVWIPKPGTDEKRPLGIPTMKDRALQALVKLALEPEWEARFEPNSYGFRPGRSCHDAIEAIFNAIRYKSKYVLDADIAKCFDRIDHEALLKKLNTFPTIRRQIRAWLKAGVMDNKQLFPTSEGTPQGGVISPLLANIALHGMEERIKKFAETIPTNYSGKKRKRESLSLIRYADDFVILHEDITVVQRCKEIISEWLKGMGLELKPSKTKLAHTLKQYEKEKPGFDFLGFNVRQFLVDKHHTGKNTVGKPLGFKTIITPSKSKQKIHYDQIASVIENHRTAPQEALIKNLNPIILGWANYYATVISHDIFSKIDHLLYQKLRAWSKRRHPKKGYKWVVKKYWHTIGGDNWVFATKQESKNLLRLLKHKAIPTNLYVKVKGESSPYDGNLVYWSSRMGKNPEMPKKVALLLKKQKGKCPHCNMFFRENDVMEVDHRIPKSQGGKNSYENWQLLHRHCHDTKTATDGSPGNQSGCNSAKPKPTKRLEKSQDKWVMRYA
ncbi:group II intron reverse transcriptase/maturase [Nostoc cf. edaphicum LEGE 07299]|uniref:Group II intron reverse transcriptase/maturase n=1 Tax=Nostoc cf. edaphicum LEGE 07299 TaxID=2777974 RepID=A0ABR9U0K4_9NOSO|nr:group II intron reverse transcriptase/maturase [Nostoc edaphicum]MBE9105897.1 group II intron reverse transcriptase/maturase [Nostoc cf. edaphicum LEGE 07299]